LDEHGAFKLWEAARTVGEAAKPTLIIDSPVEAGLIFFNKKNRVLVARSPSPLGHDEERQNREKTPQLTKLVIDVWDPRERRKLSSLNFRSPCNVEPLVASPDGNTLAVIVGAAGLFRNGKSVHTADSATNCSPSRLGLIRIDKLRTITTFNIDVRDITVAAFDAAG